MYFIRSLVPNDFLDLIMLSPPAGTETSVCVSILSFGVISDGCEIANTMFYGLLMVTALVKSYAVMSS